MIKINNEDSRGPEIITPNDYEELLIDLNPIELIRHINSISLIIPNKAKDLELYSSYEIVLLRNLLDNILKQPRNLNNLTNKILPMSEEDIPLPGLLALKKIYTNYPLGSNKYIEEITAIQPVWRLNNQMSKEEVVLGLIFSLGIAMSFDHGQKITNIEQINLKGLENLYALLLFNYDRNKKSLQVLLEKASPQISKFFYGLLHFRGNPYETSEFFEEYATQYLLQKNIFDNLSNSITSSLLPLAYYGKNN